MNIKNLFIRSKWLIIATATILCVTTGNPEANATSTTNSITNSSENFFTITHQKAKSGKSSAEGITQVIPGEGGSGCGTGGTNTGWVNYYSNDLTGLLQMCSYDAGSREMVTLIRIYNNYPNDSISSAYALATYDDGAHDADNLTINGSSSAAFMEVSHIFNNGGSHSVTLEGGFYGYSSIGRWKQKQSLTLNY